MRHDPSIPPDDWLLGLLLRTQDEYGRGVHQGIAQYIHAQTHLRITAASDEREERGMWTAAPHGLIALVTSRQRADELIARNLPVVNVSNSSANIPLPTVVSDDRAVGAMAAEHLMSRGFQYFAYVGLGSRHFSRLRGEGFKTAVLAADLTVTEFDSNAGAVSVKDAANLGHWLKEQPKPLGVFAANDVRARHVVDSAVLAGMAVPSEVAVVGVDNDQLQCFSSRVALSSVALNNAAIGYQACQALHLWLSQGIQPLALTLVPPSHVVVRRSSDVEAIGDPVVAMAVRYIWDHVDKPLTVEELLNHVPIVSRRHLERRFRQTLGRTPGEEINRARIERAKTLLRETHWSMAKIATAVGLGNYKVLSVAFHRNVGEPPTAYRQRFRSG